MGFDFDFECWMIFVIWLYLVRARDKFRDGTSGRAEKMWRGTGLLLLSKSISGHIHHSGHVMHGRGTLAVRGQQGRGPAQRIESWIAVRIVQDLKPEPGVSALSWMKKNMNSKTKLKYKSVMTQMSRHKTQDWKVLGSNTSRGKKNRRNILSCFWFVALEPKNLSICRK